MFLMAILKVAALQKEGQLNYIKPLTTKKLLQKMYNVKQKKERLFSVF
jgi:hypothetical protein